MAKLKAAARKKLPDSAFAGPGRSYPMHDMAHVKAAVKLRGHASPETQKKICARAAKHGIKCQTKTKRSSLRRP